MRHRLLILFVSFAVLAVVSAIILLACGWPGKSIDYAWRNGGWMMFVAATLEGIILTVIGMVKTSSLRVPPGSIGTESPEELPKGYLSPQYRGGSYIIAGGLILMVGTSVCWGGYFMEPFLFLTSTAPAAAPISS